MSDLLFITSNDVKFEHANHMLAAYKLTLTRQSMDFIEIQASGEEICRHKADQAYELFKSPIIVNDDSWSIPGLNGFPGAFMKDINNWLTPADWLRLTAPLADRRIILEQHIVHQDAAGQHYFVVQITGRLLTEVRGESVFNHLTITSFDNTDFSGAERLAQGEPAIKQSHTAWDELATWLQSQ